MQEDMLARMESESETSIQLIALAESRGLFAAPNERSSFNLAPAQAGGSSGADPDAGARVVQQPESPDAPGVTAGVILSFWARSGTRSRGMRRARLSPAGCLRFASQGGSHEDLSMYVCRRSPSSSGLKVLRCILKYSNA